MSSPSSRISRVEKHVLRKGDGPAETDIRACASERNAPRASERRPRRPSRSFVIAEEENRRSPTGRGPIGKGRNAETRAGASAANAFRWHVGRLFIHPRSSLLSFSFSQSLTLFLSPSLNLFLFLSFALLELACAAGTTRKARRSGDFRSGDPSTSTSPGE